MASLFKVKALYDFEAKEGDDLGFPGGQIIDVTEEVDDNWLEGKYTDAAGEVHAGIFPREFVEKYEPPLPARPTRPVRKQEPVPAPVAAPEPVASQLPDKSEDDDGDDAAPTFPMASRPAPAPTTAAKEEVTQTPSSLPTSKDAPLVAAAAAPAAPAAKKPPPVAVKSNAFKDRIAAFNQAAAQPVVPILPGKPRTTDFIKKPFVAPPPSANAFVPPPKVEPVHKPYIRDEDPEIIKKQEEDLAAAEAVGLAGDSQQQDEEAPKPTSLKERIALLQQQQLEQAQRGSARKEKKPPVKRPTDPSEQEREAGNEEDDVDEEASREGGIRASADVPRERPQIPSANRRAVEPPSHPVPEHDIVSDGNEADQSAAGETTEDETGTIGPESSEDPTAPVPMPRAPDAPKQEADVGDEEDTTETGEDEQDEIDEETRRKIELRERMAKLSGGSLMPGMNPLAGFAPRGLPPKKPSKKTEDAAPAPASPSLPQQRIPIMPMPGMQPAKGLDADDEADEDDDEEENHPPASLGRSITEERGVPPPVPRDSRPPAVPSQGERAVPPVPVPQTLATESRPVPRPPQAVISPNGASESDDEASALSASGMETPGPAPGQQELSRAAPPVPGSQRALPSPPTIDRRTSYLSNTSETPASTIDKRASRAPPPIPQSPPLTSRPPPPPPPGALSRQATNAPDDEDDDEEGESVYEGDYDTDIASGATHKEALKAHLRESSLDDGSTLADEPLSPPPLPPQTTAPRAIPPPPPTQNQTKGSTDVVRPPPLPPTRDEEYDPYRADQLRSPPPLPPVAVPAAAPPPVPQPDVDSSADEMYGETRPSVEMRPPPPPPQIAAPSESLRTPGLERRSTEVNRALSAATLTSESGHTQLSRPSLDVQRSNTVRRSAEQPRVSSDHGAMARDVPLDTDTLWWTASSPLPPILQPRRNVDILTENEESTATKRGGQSIVTKNIFILFADYSETTISAKYDSREPHDCELQQDHKSAPTKLRQDQLESYWQRFGRSIADKTSGLSHGKKDVTVPGDGSPFGFVAALIKEYTDALPPIGTKSYGALVYENMGNATTQQFDEIRPGDIVTLRGARFEGSHGAMKSKYRQDFSAGHVAVVEEWDGTKRAIRIWEHGREVDGKKDKKGGVKSDKLRLGDLKSGEVRVWRVVGRDYVGW